MARALKVFRTAIGFHDAYVAAPSQKAALEAWDTDKDLFARGAAELVTDPKLTKAPLASPGKVIKVVRGNLEEHLAAAAPLPQSRKKPPPSVDPKLPHSSEIPKRKTKPKPKPSREAVDKAELAVASFEAQSRKEIAEIRQREDVLKREREELERKHRAQSEALSSKRDQAEKRYREMMDRWRST